MTDQFSVNWIDARREPKCPANPLCPTGMDVDLSRGQAPACDLALPYPAKRCGRYEILCRDCGLTVIVTTAGRVDDPRTVKLPCKARAECAA